MPTTIKLKNSVTTTNAPSSLAQGEVAINITDKKVWVGNAATTPIQLLGAGSSASFGALTCTSLTNSGLTSGRVTYASTGGLLADSANFTFNGTTVTMANDASISGLTVGKGGGAIVGNTALGNNSLAGTNTGSENTGIGYNSLALSTSGNRNTAVGSNAMYSTTSSVDNTGIGKNALYYTTTGASNTAVGAQALQSNTTASNNTAVGYQAGYYSNGASNTALGYQALVGASGTSTGTLNTAVGNGALYSNTSASYNVAVGDSALYSNTTGANNVSVGRQALALNTTASGNTAVGYQAGYTQTTGTENTYLGYLAGNANTTQSYNTYIGSWAGKACTGANNTLVGAYAGYNLTTGNNNTFIGNSSNNACGGLVTTGSKNTIIGNYSGNQGGLDIRTLSNYIVLSDGDGNPLISTNSTRSVALNGAVPQSGTGITFPATQSASSDANTLDDYEEGTWTPRIGDASSGGNSNTSNSVGWYTKIGNQVTIYGRFDPIITTGFTAANQVWIRDLPFVSRNGGLEVIAGSVASYNFTYTGTAPTMYLGQNTTSSRLYVQATGTGGVQPLVSSITSGSTWLYFVVTYQV